LKIIFNHEVNQKKLFRNTCMRTKFSHACGAGLILRFLSVVANVHEKCYFSPLCEK